MRNKKLRNGFENNDSHSGNGGIFKKKRSFPRNLKKGRMNNHRQLNVNTNRSKVKYENKDFFFPKNLRDIKSYM